VQRSPGGAIELRVVRAWALVPVLALLHIHLHIHIHRFHGPPFDYAGLAAAAAASWVGVPGPGEPVLIAAGVLAARHQLDIVEVLFVAWLAATAGGVAGWLVGLKAGRAFVTAPGPVRKLRLRAVERGEEVFERFPVFAIVFTPSWVSGIHRVRNRIYQPINALGAAGWACLYGLGGYFAGPSVIDLVQDVGVLTAVVVVALIAVGVTLEVRRRRRPH
jgi:membrane protein DedA with SNARE-associated domain